jgi:hypothetical protein
METSNQDETQELRPGEDNWPFAPTWSWRPPLHILKDFHIRTNTYSALGINTGRSLLNHDQSSHQEAE